MMTPKEKADELIEKLDATLTYLESKAKAKECALIAVGEILDFMMNDDKESETCYWANHPLLGYWYEIKQEIENK